MQQITKFLFLGLFLLFHTMVVGQEIVQLDSQVSTEELKMMLGEWEGKLTYINYSDGSPFSLKANLKIEKGKNAYQLIAFDSYIPKAEQIKMDCKL